MIRIPIVGFCFLLFYGVFVRIEYLTMVYCMQTLEMLEKKEKVLLKKAAAEVEKAKEFTRAKNKRGMV